MRSKGLVINFPRRKSQELGAGVLGLGPSASGVLLSPSWQGAPTVTEVSSSSGHVSLSGFRLISLKVLNSIVLLGKSCQYVKGAKMEEKLFNPPPTGTPSKPPGKPQSKCQPSPGRCPPRHASATRSQACSPELVPDTLATTAPHSSAFGVRFYLAQLLLSVSLCGSHPGYTSGSALRCHVPSLCGRWSPDTHCVGTHRGRRGQRPLQSVRKRE